MSSIDLYVIYNDIFGIAPESKKSSFKKFFPTKKESDFKNKIDLLYEEYYSLMGSYVYDPAIYAEATKNVVCAYEHNKDNLISVYFEYNKLLIKKYKLDIAIEYPPIPVMNTYERLMFIAKYLQKKEHKVSDLENILWQSQRTIAKDMARLQSEEDALKVCGQKFVIKEMDRSMGHVSFGSTAHPLFLTCNLTQVITTLEGLRQMSERPEFTGYALPMAQNIWRQLSDYAKERIFYVMENLLNQDVQWYEDLDSYNEYSYRTEAECCKDGPEILMYCLKGRGDDRKRRCNIEYSVSDEESEFLTDVEVLGMSEGDSWKVSVGGKERILEGKRIIRSSFHKENMF